MVDSDDPDPNVVEVETTRPSDWPFVFLVDKDTIVQVWEVLSEYAHPVEAKFKCSDDVTRTFHTTNAALQYPNRKEGRIQNLTISTGDRVGKSASLSFDTVFRFARSMQFQVEFMASGREGEVLALKRRLEELVADTKPWYWWFARTHAIGIVGCIVVVSEVFLNAFSEPNEEYVGKFIFYAFLLAGAMHAFSRLNRMLFPYGFFKIGRCVRQFEVMEKVRFGVLFTLISLFLGWVFNFYNRL